jgi:HAD superfamily hydrolase (TIGR01549 family)
LRAAEPPRGILFDLFGTLVFLDAAHLPRVEVAGRERIVTIADLDEPLRHLESSISAEQFLASLSAVSLEIEQEKREHHRELPSRERFRRALDAVGARGNLDRVAEDLSLRHMNGLASAVVCPENRPSLLQGLARRFRIGLVSNFDHGPTARLLLERHGLAAGLASVVISQEVGLRKPAGELFLQACGELDLAPAQCIHVGDSFDADVLGATGAGLGALWIDGSNEAPPPALGTISDVSELPTWLARNYTE